MTTNLVKQAAPGSVSRCDRHVDPLSVGKSPEGNAGQKIACGSLREPPV
jgi:hypothetical protein